MHLEKAALTDVEADALEGVLLGDDAYDHLFTEDVDVYKPDGSLLCRFRQNILSEQECVAAFPVWKNAAGPLAPGNRGYAGGRITPDEAAAIAREHKGIGYKLTGTRMFVVRADGTQSSTHIAKPIQSGIVGYFDRGARFPYCRLTAYNLNHPRRFEKVTSFIQQVDRKFQELVPERYATQRKYIEQTSTDFFIHDTSFTTVTVNRNFQTAVHQDAGDLKEGFGVMSCLRRGRFSGCYFVFPKYRVALDMQTGCILCADVHEWHGNTPLHGNKGMFERVSLVFYYREKMKECGNAAGELERAKNLTRHVGRGAEGVARRRAAALA